MGSQTDTDDASRASEAPGRREWVVIGSGGAGGIARAKGRGSVARGGQGGAGADGKPGKPGQVAYGDQKRWWQFWK